MREEARPDRVVRDIAALCGRGMPWSSLWPPVRRRLRQAIPFEAWAVATTDPTTLLPTAGMREGLPESYCWSILQNETESDDFDKLGALTRASSHVGILGISTGGRPERSARYREILDPNGLERQARAVCVAGGGCWAWLDLYRERGSRDFTPTEARTLDRVAWHMAEAIRVSLLFADGPARTAEDAAGIALLGPDFDLLSADAAAERWLAELAAVGDPGGPIPLSVRAVAGRCGRAGDAEPPRARVRTRSGRWLVLHAFRPRGLTGVATAVVVEPATPLELAEMRVRAFDLTATERRVLQLTLLGLSTKEIAASLRISPYTARDHLTHVFDKTGARSRGQLFALLASTRPVRHAGETGEDEVVGLPRAGLARVT